MPKIVSLVDSPCNPDSRVMRISETLAEAGNSVTVLCKAAKGLPAGETIRGVRYLRVPMRARIIPRSGVFKFRAFRSFVEKTAVGLKPDIIHANDLITLPAALRIAKRTGAKVVYDVHDLYLHEPKRRSRLAYWQAERIERRMITRADAILTVSDGIAGHLRDTYGVTATVVMNAPDSDGSSARSLREEIGLPLGTPLGVYTGARHLSRGLDRLAEALGTIPGLHVALVGPPGAADNLVSQTASDGGFADRIHLLPAVPHNEVAPYIASADFGVLPYNAQCLNDEYSMPHKLFEAVFAGLPVIVSDLKELRAFVEQTGVGLVATDTAAIAAAMKAGLARPSSEKVDSIKQKYGWPVQAERLLTVYNSLS